jgi:hypothetical protein
MKDTAKLLESLSDEYGVRIRVAHDGMEIVLRRQPLGSSFSSVKAKLYEFVR